ncbi:MAG TPA: AMP-binding protein [Phycisphaerae bacterium]|nr:AMP-binding protein [Phycisphaerae bacterium]
MFIECLLDSVSSRPDRLAARDPFRELSNAQLARFARVISRIVRKETACERVGVMLPASTAGLGTLLGVLWAGRTAVPLNFLMQPPELAAVAKDARIDLILATRHFESQLANMPVRVLYLEQLPLKRFYLLEGLRRTPKPPRVSQDDLAAIVYTSGSTGQPRGVCLSHGNLMSNCRAAAEHFHLDSSHHLLGMIPPFHVFGLTIIKLLPVVIGAAITYVPRFSPQAVVEVARRGEVSVIMAVPSMFAAIARLKSVTPGDFPGIRLAVSGGEPLPNNLYEEVRRKTGLNLLEGYGMTETSPVISANQPGAQRVGSVGRPIPGVEVQVRDTAGRALPTGETGELYVRGPGVMKGYFNRPQETAATVDADGWLRTGDIVHIDADGFITITGRAKEMMIVAGENVYPREVEAVLERHPSVREAAVIGRRDEHRGEAVVAFVIPGENTAPTANELRAFCRDHLASHKIPREVHVVQDLPRGPTGKILKRELKARVET